MLLSHVSGSLYTAVCAGMIRILQLLCSSSTFIILLLSRTGVPKQHRGEVWKFLSEQHLLRQTVSSQPPPDNTAYKELLKQVSSEQHAILIDLGTSDMHYTHISTPTLMFCLHTSLQHLHPTQAFSTHPFTVQSSLCGSWPSVVF